MRLFNACLLILFLTCLTALSGEPFAFRILANFQMENAVMSGQGLCVPVKSRGKKLILTALHLVQNGDKQADEVFVEFPEGWIRCKLVKKDPSCDLCLLEPALKPSFTVEVASDDPKPGDEVLNPNFFHSRKMEIQKGKVSENRQWLWSGKVEWFSHGSSGGPMIDKDGKIVGLGVAGRSEDGGVTMTDAICVGPRKIKEFLDRDDEK